MTAKGKRMKAATDGTDMNVDNRSVEIKPEWIDWRGNHGSFMRLAQNHSSATSVGCHVCPVLAMLVARLEEACVRGSF